AVGNGRVDAGTAAVARVRRARVAVVAIDACMVAALHGVAGVDGAGIAVVAAAAPDRRARAVAATAAGNVVAIARAVVARTRATGTFLRAAARPAVVLPAHAVGLPAVARFPVETGASRAVGRRRTGRVRIAGAVREVDDLVTAARERAIDAAVVRGAAVRLALVAFLPGIDEAVAARDAPADARRGGPAGGPHRARGSDAPRAVGTGHDRGAVGGAGERSPERIAERLAGRAGECRECATEPAGIARLARLDRPVAADGRDALRRVEG